MMLDLLFPNRCLECNRIIDADLAVCNLCFSHIHFTHFDFSGNNILKERCLLLFPVAHAFALMQFEKENISRKIVHELKYRNREKIGKMIAGWFPQYLDFKGHQPDLFVTVPLHPRKQRERGYNQLHAFTDALSDLYGIPADHSLIKRNHYSKAQALKDKQHRLQAENTFSLTRSITGKHILLIDDVFTTGNTLATIAWEILSEPGNMVSVLVMAMDE
ncbi:double zinc ribbon domain-containing protein [uncultured Chryseobacterium sp.]|uniref:ComF family protein n=1 Tax=uncultured Chryseobacterium sp. TaxID=259322 RepID=UPI0025F51614|nr:double zinc ribbon domain-containing protein [uncultured Chryseobacterium sp.]